MKRIFLICHHPLFARGLERILRKQTDITIVGQAMEPAQAIAAIKRLQPDVVIVDCHTARTPWSQGLIEMLRAAVDMTVIAMSLHDNAMHIYRGEHRTIRSIDDLADAIVQPGQRTDEISDPHRIQNWSGDDNAR